jgi:predicted lipoprotein with Yx(FWY)xxD motif
MKTAIRIIIVTKGISGAHYGDCMRTTSLILLILLILVTAMITGCTQQQVQSTPELTPIPTAQPTAAVVDTVKVTSSSVGTILTDSQGKTLYYFANDIPSKGTSACNGQCATLWPPFSAGTVSVSSPLDPADFNSISRTDGTKQTTYYGWPLYYYSRDPKTGDVNGENFLSVWFTIRPDESVLLAHTPALGLYLTDTSGKTLYYFMKDTASASACTGSCSSLWPPFNASPITAPSLVKTADFSTVNRADGMNQMAYRGKPLYFYNGDANPGDTKGQAFNNLWYVANVSGLTPVMTTQPTTLNTLSPYGGGVSGGGGGY